MKGLLGQGADLWPRRASGLPPGQRRLTTFPRFSAQPRRPPPAATGPAGLTIRGAGPSEVTLGLDELTDLGWRELTRDLHCVATWTRQGLTWGGVQMLTVWDDVVVPRLGKQAAASFIRAVATDGYQAVLHRDDLLQPDVMLALTLDGEPLDARHGAPLRLVSPAQYGYKSVKHLVALELHDHRPTSWLGAKEHLRARVAFEERHSRVPGRLLRVPYRLTIPVIALTSERSAAAEKSEGPDARP